MKNLYQCLPPTRKFDFPIPAQAHNGQEPIRDYQRPNHNPSIAHSNFVIAEPMRSRIKRLTRVIEYNGDLESDNNNEDIGFADVNLPCNKLSLQLLANDSITRIKKRRVITNDKDDELLKPKTNREKRKEKTRQASCPYF